MRTRTAEVFIDEAEILHIRVLKNASIDLSDAIDSFILAQNLSKGLPKLVLADMRLKRSMAIKARRLFETENVPAKHIAKALLVNSPLIKNLNNILVRKKSKNPVRTFTSEQKAIAWLKSFS